MTDRIKTAGAGLRTPEAARYMAISRSRLTQLRVTGEGPPFIKIAARAVAYRRSDLDAWLESRVRRTTADK
jgi:predicted DNA-binding transcriptional regulator AlpA